MAIFKDAAGNTIDTIGSSQVSSAANSPAVAAESIPATDSNANPVADFKYTDPITFAVIVSRG